MSASNREDEIETNQLLRIYNALYNGQSANLKKKHAWKDAASTGDSSALTTAMNAHAEKDHTRTAEAKKLHDRFKTELPNWDNPQSPDYDPHRSRVILLCHEKAYEHSGFFARTHDIRPSLQAIIKKAEEKPNSRTAKIVNALKQ